jgi:2Fe-2S ferredoxin
MMRKVTFVSPDGEPRALEAADGENLKQVAIDNLVPGIIGDCGGFSECGTCHGYIDQRSFERLAPPTDAEEYMLEGLVGEVRPTSRLLCQIEMKEDLDGISVTFPAQQG